MKKILFALMAVFAFGVCQAQVPVKVKKAITGADTVTISNVGSKVVGLQATFLETSGTSAGKFYFEGSIDGLGWQSIDSTISLSDVATYQTRIVTATATNYKDFRVRCSNTSAAVGTLWFTVLRRSDDR